MLKNLFFILAVCLFQVAAAQDGSKKSLTHADYDQWMDITYKAISPDGRQASYLLTPQYGNGVAVFRNLKTGTIDSARYAADLMMSYDGAHAVFKIKPDPNVVKELRRQKKKKEELPKDGLGIYTFLNRSTVKIADVKSFRLPTRSGGWLAYQLEAVEVKGNGSKKKIKKNNDENGFTLIIRKLADGTEKSFGYVRDYQLSKFGQAVLFATSGNDSTMKAGVYRHDLSTGVTTALYTGKSKFKHKGLAINDSADQASFLVDSDTTKALVRHWQLFHWATGQEKAVDLEIESAGKIPVDRLVSEHYTPLFSKNGERLFFGVSEFPAVADTTLLPEEIVQVEVWNTEDEYIYPQQKVLLDREKKKNFLSVIDLKDPARKVKVLASPEIPFAETGDEGNANVVLLSTDVPYRKMITWDTRVLQDSWIHDLKTGLRKQVTSKIQWRPSLSPDAKFVLWYNSQDTSWYTYQVSDGKITRLKPAARVSFADEEDDHPNDPDPYGVAGWIQADARILVYDRYDIWSFDPTGVTPAVNLTNGRSMRRVYRYVKLDPDQRAIAPAETIFISVFDEITKESGYARLSLKNLKRTDVIFGPARYAGLAKATKTDQYLFTRETFREFPDVWVSGLNFSSAQKISEANPQWTRYRWGTAEPVSWKAPDGRVVQGLLYKPDGFDPAKKYPMMVTFYERNSDDLYLHSVPFPHRSTINKTMYVSNGYVVFVPDVHYRVGYPGPSALDYVTSGVQALIEKGFVDEKRIGVQGHSWGGYQVAYMVTKTNMFRAAEAGAIVANMVSAYGGIRWESGLARMFQYEKDQSRLGATLWEKPELYLENSPIFDADKINTPLLLLHNDADGAVPWYQGIEMYLALRRLGKPSWMLNYNGEPHWPLKRENRIDFQTRMMQFFNHYLKDAPAPVWMKEGVPAIRKGIDRGY